MAKTTHLVNIDVAKIGGFCRKWKIAELAVFGSVLRDDFRPDSDVDFLVTFTNDADWSLIDHMAMEIELEALLNRKVDVFTRRSIEASHNWIRRRQILSSARTIHAA